jgi:exo-beta-1,3-glucanase (GH17 family)
VRGVLLASTWLSLFLSASLWGCSPAASQPTSPAPAGERAASDVTGSVVTTRGYEIQVAHARADGTVSAAEQYTIRGVCWSPTTRGESRADFERWVDVDAPLMKAAHMNTVRTFSAPPQTPGGRRVLDVLHRHGIKVIMTVFAGWDDDRYVQAVNYFKDHPAILMWMVGNEVNFNHLYARDKGLPECVRKVNQVVSEIKAADSRHPVAVSWWYYWGNHDLENHLAGVEADVVGMQVYPEEDFRQADPDTGAIVDVFELYRSRAAVKPMFLSEFGCDDYDTRHLRVDHLLQARGAVALLSHIKANLVRRGGVCSGGTIFEWADELWKGEGDASRQDDFGIDPPGMNPYPDGVFNEEHFGLTDVDRNPKEALREVAKLYKEF